MGNSAPLPCELYWFSVYCMIVASEKRIKCKRRDGNPARSFRPPAEGVMRVMLEEARFRAPPAVHRHQVVHSSKICAGRRSHGCSFAAVTVAMWFMLVVSHFGDGDASSLMVHKYSTRVVKTKYGPLRGVMIHIHPPVEAFLGVPYATPPVGSLRYMPPVTPSLWKNTRLADRFSPVCPQRPPDIGNRTEALLEYPRGRLHYLEKLLPLLANQSEDCLYMNVYVPRTASGDEEPNPLPCIVYVHGESYEWNSGNPYDGTVLASAGRVIVVTINFRLGVLGFLKTGTKGSAQGNFGLMDLVAGLHWLRENLDAFGGDPERVTLMGHGTGAALVNFIAVSPVAKELLHRTILLSGSGLSPWAMQRDPLFVKRRVAEHTGCHGDLLEDDLAPCLRLKPLNQLLSVSLEPPRFLPGFAPFIDGTILLNPTSPPAATGTSTVATSTGYELADFRDRDLLFGLTSTESYLDLSAQDLEFGFNETRRDRVLRTYVRNSYYYHLNEIFSTLKNEYTDWEKPMQNPLSVRDATLEVLSDGHTAAPLIRIGYLHALRGGKTFFLHFHHQSGERDFPQRSGSVRGEDIPYILGLPLVSGGTFFPHNYSHSDIQISKMLIHYISNFARKGDPNGASQSSSNLRRDPNDKSNMDDVNAPFWDTYDTINQLYMELGNKAEIRNHYRGHKMSLWLNLIPQLHRPGEADDISMRHHHFQEEGPQYYDGSVRPQTLQRPTHVAMQPPTTSPLPIVQSTPATPPPPKSDTALQATTTECTPNSSYVIPQQNQQNLHIQNSKNNLLRKLASSHYQSYTTALTVTIAVGCFLLLLNILIFAGIYHQRDRGRSKRKKEELESGSCSSSPGDAYEMKRAFDRRHSGYDSGSAGGKYDLGGGNFECKEGLANFIGEYSAQQYMEKRSLADVQMTQLPLQDFQASPPSGVKRAMVDHPPDVTSSAMISTTRATATMTSQDTQTMSTINGNGSNCCNSSDVMTSPGIPEPPPPPKNMPPMCNNQGILRNAPTTPGTMKKRVQIQEISV